MKKLPSLFNDVIGPVMRGPSSSHTAASWRIARTSLDVLGEALAKALIEFDQAGAWATNYREQGTTMGIDGGLLGLEMADERMKDTERYALSKGVSIEYRVSSFPTNHANTVRLTLWGTSNKKVQIVAASLGGGSFEIQSVNGFEVSFNGDGYELFFFTNGKPGLSGELNESLSDEVTSLFQQQGEVSLYEYKSSEPFTSDFLAKIQDHSMVDEVLIIQPVMPVIFGRQSPMPFTTIQSLLAYAEETNSDLGDLGLIYEQCLSGISDQELTRKMAGLVEIIHKSVDTGLGGTQYDDRILQQQSHLIGKAQKAGKVGDSVVNDIIANVTALMESKSGMEVIVAVPTAGSCGTVGGSLRALADNRASSQEEMVKAYFAAGLVGAYFAQGPGFSAEEHGCQVECGAASGMAAAAMAQLMGGTARQALGAASMAIQNMIGLVCDPVADRVEVPCLGKNISAAVNAYSSAIMAVSGFDEVIPLDQVIQTVSRVSKTMPTCVKCTGKGGLAITDAAIQLKKRLKDLKA